MTNEELAEAIERLRAWANFGNEGMDGADVLVVCDAAARCAEAEQTLKGEEYLHACTRADLAATEIEHKLLSDALKYEQGRSAIVARERDELKVNVASRIRCAKDADAHLRRIVAERDEARATLAGIERLLDATWELHKHPDTSEYGWVRDPLEIMASGLTLPAAVAAAVAELEKETT